MRGQTREMKPREEHVAELLSAGYKYLTHVSRRLRKTGRKVPFLYEHEVSSVLTVVEWALRWEGGENPEVLKRWLGVARS